MLLSVSRDVAFQLVSAVVFEVASNVSGATPKPNQQPPKDLSPKAVAVSCVPCYRIILCASGSLSVLMRVGSFSLHAFIVQVGCCSPSHSPSSDQIREHVTCWWKDLYFSCSQSLFMVTSLLQRPYLEILWACVDNHVCVVNNSRRHPDCFRCYLQFSGIACFSLHRNWRVIWKWRMQKHRKTVVFNMLRNGERWVSPLLFYLQMAVDISCCSICYG